MPPRGGVERDPRCPDRLGLSFFRFGVCRGGVKTVMATWLWNMSVRHRLHLVIVFFNVNNMPMRVVSARSGVYTDEGSLLDLGGCCLGGLCPTLQAGVLCSGRGIYGESVLFPFDPWCSNIVLLCFPPVTAVVQHQALLVRHCLGQGSFHWCFCSVSWDRLLLRLKLWRFLLMRLCYYLQEDNDEFCVKTLPVMKRTSLQFGIVFLLCYGYRGDEYCTPVYCCFPYLVEASIPFQKPI